LKKFICLFADIFLQTIGCKILICLFVQTVFSEFYKRLAVKLLFAICGPISQKVVPGKKIFFGKKDLQRISLKTLFAYLQIYVYKQLALKSLFAYLQNCFF
jgi:hypothetical protein